MYETSSPALSDPATAQDATVTATSLTRVGVSSWSDRSLTHESSWYPKRTMKAAERLGNLPAAVKLSCSEWLTPDHRGYRYGENELCSLATRISRLDEATSEVHVLVGTCWRDDAVINTERACRRC